MVKWFNKKKRFVILCFQRSGSYYLVDLLDRQQDVSCHGELFKAERVELASKLREQTGYAYGDVQRRDADPATFLDAVFAATPDPVVGFKLFGTHCPGAIDTVLADRGIRKVLLTRNPVQSYVSLLCARATGSWTRRDPAVPSPHTTVRFEVEDFLDHVRTQAAFFERVGEASATQPAFAPFFIGYEELWQADRLRELAAYLRVPRWNPATKSGYFKQRNRPYPEIVSNWDEVQMFCAARGVDENQPFMAFCAGLQAAVSPAASRWDNRA